jgi:hypothetical protein
MLEASDQFIIETLIVIAIGIGVFLLSIALTLFAFKD